MSLRRDLNAMAPRLRRFARALIASDPRPNEAADALVATTLRRVFEAPASISRRDLQIEAFTALIEINRALCANRLGLPVCPSAGGQRRPGATADGGFHARLQEAQALHSPVAGAMAVLALESREVFLLVVLEGLSYASAGRILKIARETLMHRLAHARAHLADTSSVVAMRPPRGAPHLRLVQ